MNELEKAYEEIKHWYCCAEQEGMTYEGEIIYLDYIKKHINNLQSKIDKANEILNKRYEEDKEIFEGDYDFKFILDFEEELLDILKEDK